MGSREVGFRVMWKPLSRSSCLRQAYLHSVRDAELEDQGEGEARLQHEVVVLFLHECHAQAKKLRLRHELLEDLDAFGVGHRQQEDRVFVCTFNGQGVVDDLVSVVGGAREGLPRLPRGGLLEVVEGSEEDELDFVERGEDLAVRRHFLLAVSGVLL